jgi:hypothetical protein
VKKKHEKSEIFHEIMLAFQNKVLYLHRVTRDTKSKTTTTNNKQKGTKQ